MTPKTQERRSGTVRRDLNSLVRDKNQELSERRTFSIIGKAICVWLLISYPDALIQRWDALTVLLAFLIATEVAKSMIERKTGTYVSESRQSETKTVKRIDNPDR